MSKTTQHPSKAPKPHYGPPVGTMTYQKQCLDFNQLPPPPKYQVLPMGKRFGVGRRIDGLPNAFDLIRDHALERTAAQEVQDLNKKWEEKTTEGTHPLTHTLRTAKANLQLIAQTICQTMQTCYN